MAPEVITKDGYSSTVDFYSLGVLIYEIVVGRPPFVWSNHQDLFKKVTKNNIPFPKNMSSKLKSFLSALLHKDPQERLGAKHGLSEIVNHPWCEDLEFVKIASKKVKAPIKPDIYAINFSREFVDEEVHLGDVQTSNIEYQASNDYAQYGNELEQGKDKGMFFKFANFSFDSHNDDPYEKFDDSIFGTIEDEVSREFIKTDSLTMDFYSTIGSPQDSARKRLVFIFHRNYCLIYF